MGQFSFSQRHIHIKEINYWVPVLLCSRTHDLLQYPHLWDPSHRPTYYIWLAIVTVCRPYLRTPSCADHASEPNDVCGTCLCNHAYLPHVVETDHAYGPHNVCENRLRTTFYVDREPHVRELFVPVDVCGLRWVPIQVHVPIAIRNWGTTLVPMYTRTHDSVPSWPWYPYP